MAYFLLQRELISELLITYVNMIHFVVVFLGRMLTPATLSDLDGIDMMDLPVDLEEPDITFTQADIK